MSDFWGMRHRLLLERVETLLPPVAGEIADEEIVRLACAASVVLRRHEVDRRGRCRHCHRSGLRWSPRRKVCTVHLVFAVALEQPFDVVWAWSRDR